MPMPRTSPPNLPCWARRAAREPDRGPELSCPGRRPAGDGRGHVADPGRPRLLRLPVRRLLEPPRTASPSDPYPPAQQVTDLREGPNRMSRQQRSTEALDRRDAPNGSVNRQ
jgi:hypothetical protein